MTFELKNYTNISENVKDYNYLPRLLSSTA